MDSPSRADTLLERAALRMATPFVLVDAGGGIVAWNHGAEALLGWTSQEAIGQPLGILYPDATDDRADAALKLQAPAADPTAPCSGETYLRHKDGASLAVAFAMASVVDDAGEPAGRSLCLRDVTPQRALENQLRWRIGEMELLDEIARAVQGTLDLDRILQTILIAVTAGTGLGFNRAILFLVGEGELSALLGMGASNWEEAEVSWSRVGALPNLSSVIDALLSEPDTEATIVRALTDGWNIPLDDDDDVIVRCVRGIESRMCSHPEAEAPGSFERLRSPMFAVVPVVHGGEAIGAILADNAVTHRQIDEHAVRLLRLLANAASAAIINARLYQQQIDHARRLEEANRQIKHQQELMVRGRNLAALGEIAEAISHEVKGPLVPIGGLARAVRRDLDESSAEAPMLDTIISETSRLERVVDSVLALSKPPRPNPQPIDVKSAVGDALAIYRADAEARQIKLVADVADDVEPPSFDRDQWRQMLQLLLANALAASPDGGDVRLAIRGTADSAYRLTVSDTGAGYDAKDIPKVFSAFYAGTPTGDSMGLNVVAQIVELHHGRVSVESAPGAGTGISVEIPPPDVMRRLIDSDLVEDRREDTGAELDPLTVNAFTVDNVDDVDDATDG